MNRTRGVGPARVVIPVTMIAVGVIGFVTTLLVSVFFLDRYNAYGEVPIPGTATLHLPAGEATVSLHTQVVASPTGSGLPVPKISMTVVSPDGADDPVFSESIGGTTTVNNDAHRRLWRMQVTAEGDYQITTDGQLGGYISPRLAFGHHDSHVSLVWISVALAGLGVLGLVRAPRWLRFPRRVPEPTTAEPASALTPGEEGIRLEQLKTIAALRDSGALTPAEFEAEKRRILSGR